MIDLRTDTVTRPTEAMLESMREATFGDDSRDGDPTVMKLERLAAERMGKEAAAFLPSGTMANLVALLAHAQRGGEVLLEQGSHTLNAELGGIAGIAGLFYRGLPGRRGAMDVAALREAVRPTLRNQMGTALICMENTHNRAGGAVLPPAHMQAVYGIARDNGVPVHLDGARIFNAAIAVGCEPGDISRYSDSVCFCVSKGLSAPVGSVLCGSAAFIERARAFRRMVGGNMRQSGPLAAAGIVALETMVARLVEDHQGAKRLAEGLHRIDPSLVDPRDVETNLVRVEVRKSGRRAAQWSADLKEKGILVSPCDAYALRFVTHRHVSAPDVDAALNAFAELWTKS
ncbi:MAG: aminotransferase class I/II-fold pyridoxal phosphate-dependent enzyme [Betaproteobacteria bacterium]|nr:aminotransferase class I/II-fold pyridoxal phosphate-dependent enzyme [Betaproteobacteria bacterium]